MTLSRRDRHSEQSGDDKAFQTIPISLLDRPGARIDQTDFFESPLSSPEVAGTAGDDKIVQIGTATAAVWQNMVELQPEALESGMLAGISAAPWQGVTVMAMHSLSNLSPDDRDATEAAPIAVAVDYCPPQFCLRFLCRISYAFGQHWRCTLD